MYFRYLFWNFVGKQNDRQNYYSDLLNGNWLSGINFLDEGRLGPQNVPDSLKNGARNTFYYLPLLFGLLGLYYHFKKSYKDGLVVALLFIMTGLAIVVYLNQQSPQPRERDYAYAASFYAFAIWIGLSVPAVVEFLEKKISPRLAGIIASGIVILLVPVIMGAKGWNDHDRSGRRTALEVAHSYLESCAPNAILFTNGDNDTFPLWYAQEVEGFRTDVRVCNLSLLGTDWYIEQMMRKAYESEPLPFTLPKELYRNGSHDFTFLVEQENIKDYVEVKELFSILLKDEKKLQISTDFGQVDYFPTKKFRITVDPQAALRSGTVAPGEAALITNLEWNIRKSGITKAYLMMLDLLAHNNWERPVYYVTTTSSEAYLGLEDYMRQEGLAYRLVPVKFGRGGDGAPRAVNTAVMYENLMNKFEFDITKPGIYINEDNYRMATTYRSTYSRLARALVAENKLDSAVSVCDRIMEMVPDKIVPLGYFNLAMGETYYAAGDKEKGYEIFRRMADIQEEQLDYYLSFPDNLKPAVQFEIEQCLAIMQTMARSAEDLQQTDLQKEISDKMDLYYNLYVGKQYNP
jgi:tetratricopeptide (TPR) repeat protein